MRKGVVVAGIVVVIIGALLLLVALFATSTSESIPNPSTGEAVTFSPNFIGSGTVSLSWSDGGSQFRFSVYQCTSSDCSNPKSTAPIANGAGNSGSVSFSATGGQYYIIVVTAAQAGGNAIPVTVSLSGGLTPLLLIGIIVLALGALIALFGYRAKAKPKVVYEDDVAPKRDSFVTTSKPFTGVQQGPAATATSAAPQYRPDAPESSGRFTSSPRGRSPTGRTPPLRPPRRPPVPARRSNAALAAP